MVLNPQDCLPPEWWKALTKSLPYFFFRIGSTNCDTYHKKAMTFSCWKLMWTYACIKLALFSFSKEIELCKIFAGSTDQIHEFLPWVQSNPRFLSSSFLLTSESSKADQCCTHSNYLYQDTWKRVGKTTVKQVTEIWTGFCTWCKICSELIIFQILRFTG